MFLQKWSAGRSLSPSLPGREATQLKKKRANATSCVDSQQDAASSTFGAHEAGCRGNADSTKMSAVWDEIVMILSSLVKILWKNHDYVE